MDATALRQAVEPTSLQTLLGIHVVHTEFKDAVELILALVAALAALALRRRHWMLRSRGFVMISGAFLLEVLGQGVQRAAQRWFEAASVVLFFWGAILLTRQMIDGITHRRRAHFSPIFRDLVVAFLYAIVLLAVLRINLRFDVTSLAVSSTVVGAALGFGLQETLGNMFNGLSLQLQSPFTPGDWVRFRDQVGYVLGTNWRSTSIVTRANERVEIPNGLLTRDILFNYATGRVADEVTVGLPYAEPPNRVRSIAARVLTSIPQVLADPPPEIMAWAFGESAIQYRLRYWLANYEPVERVRDEVVTRLWYALRRDSVEIPFPTRTVLMQEPQSPHLVRADRESMVAAELRKIDFLCSLSDQELQLLMSEVSIHQFAHGEYLEHEGEIGECFHLLLRGKVEILARGANGRTERIRELAAPNVVGEIALLQGIPRTASVVATTDVEVAVVTKAGFDKMLKANPEIAEEIARIVAPRLTETAERVRSMHDGSGAVVPEKRLLARMREIFDI